MDQVWPQLVLVVVLVAINGLLAGSEIALVSLRESQVARMARTGRTGEIVARLARDPNQFLSTIQIGITLAGFLASATAAVTLAEPVVPLFEFLGGSARTVAVVVVTLVLSYVTLVLGELAPKRLALQRPEMWSLLVSRPLLGMAAVSKPVVWLLGVSTNAVMRLVGGEPSTAREQVDLDELREIVEATKLTSADHREVLLGAFEVSERTLREVLIPRPDVVSLASTLDPSEALTTLLSRGHSRAPVALGGELDDTLGLVHIRDLVGAETQATLEDLANPIEALPESLPVLVAMRTMQEDHHQMVLVVDEFGGVAGIVTIEDLVEEVVGEIYDEVDRNVRSARHEPDGSLLIDGRYPVHDLGDLGVHVPEGEYTTVAGLVLERLGHVPEHPGDRVVVDGWEVTILALRGRSIGRTRFRRVGEGATT